MRHRRVGLGLALAGVDLHQVEYLVGVVEYGGFGRAAKALHVSQPALSQGVRGLERELRLELFHRTKRGVVLSTSGAAILGPAQQLLRDLQTLRATADSLNGLGRGQLDLVCLPTLAVFPMVSLMGTFRRAHPDIELRLLEPESAEQLLDLVRSTRCELGITDVLVSDVEELVVEELDSQEIVAVRPPGSQAVTGGMSIELFEGVPLVVTPRGTSCREVMERAFRDAGIHPLIAVETSQREAVIPLVVAGAGTAFLPMSVVSIYDRLATGAMVVHLKPILARTIGFVYRSRPLSPAAEAFLQEALCTPERLDSARPQSISRLVGQPR